MGLVSGEDQEGDLIRKTMETEVGARDGFLRTFERLITVVITNPRKYPCEQLQTAAALTLAKFMLMR